MACYLARTATWLSVVAVPVFLAPNPSSDVCAYLSVAISCAASQRRVRTLSDFSYATPSKGMSLHQLWFWMALRQWQGVLDHTGYQLPWDPLEILPGCGGTKFHDDHHQYVRVARGWGDNPARVHRLCRPACLVVALAAVSHLNHADDPDAPLRRCTRLRRRGE